MDILLHVCNQGFDIFKSLYLDGALLLSLFMSCILIVMIVIGLKLPRLFVILSWWEKMILTVYVVLVVFWFFIGLFHEGNLFCCLEYDIFNNNYIIGTQYSADTNLLDILALCLLGVWLFIYVICAVNVGWAIEGIAYFVVLMSATAHLFAGGWLFSLCLYMVDHSTYQSWDFMFDMEYLIFWWSITFLYGWFASHALGNVESNEIFVERNKVFPSVSCDQWDNALHQTVLEVTHKSSVADVYHTFLRDRSSILSACGVEYVICVKESDNKFLVAFFSRYVIPYPWLTSKSYYKVETAYKIRGCPRRLYCLQKYIS